jgi:hypothetical protein
MRIEEHHRRCRFFFFPLFSFIARPIGKMAARSTRRLRYKCSFMRWEKILSRLVKAVPRTRRLMQATVAALFTSKQHQDHIKNKYPSRILLVELEMSET